LTIGHHLTKTLTEDGDLIYGPPCIILFVSSGLRKPIGDRRKSIVFFPTHRDVTSRDRHRPTLDLTATGSLLVCRQCNQLDAKQLEICGDELWRTGQRQRTSIHDKIELAAQKIVENDSACWITEAYVTNADSGFHSSTALPIFTQW